MCCTARDLLVCCGLAVSVLVLPHQAIAQAPEGSSPTLWKFLGIPQAFGKVNAQLFNRRGNMPQLESKPPLKPIAAASNLAADMPKPIQAAAKIKQAEDLAPQKVKAIKYLAKIGCACYDKQGEVTDAIVAAMGDCTERVRLEAVSAIATAAADAPCSQCGSKCCCDVKILQKLAELAYERGSDGCFLEPSARVRQAAAEALTVCCTTTEPIEVLEEDGEEQPIERPLEAASASLTDRANGSEQSGTGRNRTAGTATAGQFSLSSLEEAQGPKQFQASFERGLPVPGEIQSAFDSKNPTTVMPRRGNVTFVDVHQGTARVQFDVAGKVPVGTTVAAYHKFLFKTTNIGEYAVIGWKEGEAIIRKADGRGIGKLARGDKIVLE